jgi:two-component system sensor histidine kinase GlrK
VTKKNTPDNKPFIIGSLYQWALASFLVVTLPLVFAIIYSLIEVTNYTEKSQLSLFQTVSSTESSRILLERLLSMERSIKQFKVLNEPELFDAYQEHRNTFQLEMESLKTKGLDGQLLKKLKTLEQNESLFHENIINNLEDDQFNVDLIAFDPLTTQVRALLTEGEKRVGTEATALSVIAKRVKQRMVYFALLSIPLALLLVLLFVHLLTRPIKNIGQAIRNLGDIGFEQPIAIKGPQDLVDLGLHLEWLRQKLNRVEYEKKLFIRNVSHELKTPLATLKEGTDLLAENVVGELNTEQHEIIQLMKISNISINDLVENLLEYQQTISTQIDFNFSNFDLSSLVERVTNEYQLLIQSKNITLKTNLNSTNISADYDKLKIIISNLFSNALKFSPQDGTIGLSLLSLSNNIVLIIEDQGPGISKEIQPFIFQNFYRGNSPSQWKIKGSGLGLAIVKHYLDALKGTIEILAANKEYCGARFALQLPQKQESC